MKFQSSNCQSCNQKPVEIIDSQDNEHFPYQLCSACHDRLINRALRPLEYFNLVSKHGLTYCLCDDFYSTKGDAGHPEILFVHDEELNFPEFDSVQKDLEALIDYAIVLLEIDDSILLALKKFDRSSILSSFKRRINENHMLGYKIYDLSAKILGSFAAEWIRNELRHRGNHKLTIYVQSLAMCLPVDEGFNFYVGELNKIENLSELINQMMGLIHFRSELTLDWIESNIKRIINISQHWGYLVVASKFTWQKAESWLNSGRPLSIVALDALANCAVTSETMNSTLWLKNNPQKLINPEEIGVMNSALQNYQKTDNAKRIRDNIAFIQNNWTLILADK